MNKQHSGFTLIELMIVVAIIGILAAIAVPAYLDYSVRTQVSHGLTVAAGAKTSVTEFYQENGAYPADNATAGLAPANTIISKYVSQVAVTGAGLIEITFGNDVNTKILGAVLTMTPADNQGSVGWTCTGDAVLAPKWLPPACRP